jgi:enediyne biosynthesis protein E4
MYARSAFKTAAITLFSVSLLTLGVSGNIGCTSSGSASTASPSPDSTAGAASAAGGPPAFRDVTRAAGINYKWTAPGERPLNILQTIGNGAAFLDYDRDGNLDILLVGQPPALYKGDGKGRFTDVSGPSGIGGMKGYFLGCAVGDYDNDGYPDIYLTAYRGGALLRNQGGKGFKDVAKGAGIPAQPWGTSAGLGDINRDGYLDLYIGNYVIFGPKTDPQLCDNQGIKTSCGPRFYKPEKSRLYLGGPGFKFKEVTEQWKAHEVEGKALGVAFADYDGTGKTHLAIANDEMPGDLLENKGGGFENIGKTSGTAYDDSGNVHGGMGIDWGDYNNDGKLDLTVGTFQNEAKNIYQNDGDGLFTDRSAMLGMAPATPLVTFGIKWLDYDNDGWLDLILANGHVQDNIAEIDKSANYRQPTQLFRNEEGQRFTEVSGSVIDESGRRPIVGRGLAVGDYDNDGKPDVLIVDSEGEPILLHNETPDAGNALLLNLVGGKSNRDALGARVEVTAGGKTYIRQCVTDGSYMSASDKRVHVGIGKATTAETVTVHWPSGKKMTVKEVPVNKPFEIKEG